MQVSTSQWPPTGTPSGVVAVSSRPTSARRGRSAYRTIAGVHRRPETETGPACAAHHPASRSAVAPPRPSRSRHGRVPAFVARPSSLPRTVQTEYELRIARSPCVVELRPAADRPRALEQTSPQRELSRLPLRKCRMNVVRMGGQRLAQRPRIGRGFGSARGGVWPHGERSVADQAGVAEDHLGDLEVDDHLYEKVVDRPHYLGDRRGEACGSNGAGFVDVVLLQRPGGNRDLANDTVDVDQEIVEGGAGNVVAIPHEVDQSGAL